MWVFKINTFFDFLFYLNLTLIIILDFTVELAYSYMLYGLTILNYFELCLIPLNPSIVLVGKFLTCVGFLILIRGGTPRYRYDYLTKLGWLKFVGLLLFVYVAILLIYFLF